MTSSRVRRSGATRTAAFTAAAFLAAASLSACSNELAEPDVNAAATSAKASSEETKPSVSETASKESASAKPNSEPVCDNSLINGHATSGAERFEFFECEGGFGFIGIPNSDITGYVQWNGREWEPLIGEGSFYSEMYGADDDCFTAAQLDKLKVPESIRVKMVKCEQVQAKSQQEAFDQAIANQPKGDPNSSFITVVNLGEAGESASYPACDGRNILILDSVIDRGSGTANEIAQQVLMQHPSGRGVKFTVPGQCPSLRAKVDGNYIYPIYIDYLNDVNAMCAAKATYGGNGRVLSNREEYVDPC